MAEPVQVYLRSDEKERLERLAAELETTKSDILRRGLEALEREVSDPERHPALEIIGIATGGGGSGEGDLDPAHDHDRVLAETEVASWKRGSRP